MRVAIVHDWLTGMRGGERVLEALLDLFPEAEIFTLIHHSGSVSHKIERRAITTSFVNRIPYPRRVYRHLLPLFPRAVESLDVSGFDLVISSSHCVAKGVRRAPRASHLCYCHTPMRYVWDQYSSYFGPGRASMPVRVAMRFLAPRLRRWDVASAGRVDRYVANSEHVRGRISRYYGKDSRVVYPPVDVGRFDATRPREDFYLIVSALVAYKRIDVAVEAFKQSGKRLVVVGDGTEAMRLRASAGPNITFMNRVTDQEVAEWMARCRAFVVTAEEDFGITAVEAQAAGAPVIALGRGGSLETVVGAPGPDDSQEHGAGQPTGVFFDEQTPTDLVAAIERFETMEFDRSALAANASRFNLKRFRAGILDELEALLGVRVSAP